MRRPGGAVLAGDKGRHRLGHILFEVIRRVVFLATANFADEEHRFGLWVFFKKGQEIDEAHAVDRIAADADHCRLGRCRAA